MEKEDDFYKKCSDSFHLATKKPEDFLETNESLSKQLRNSLKLTYDFTKNEEIKKIKSNALPELIVENFDLEQIWQQIELQNDSLLTRSLTTVSKLLVGKAHLVFNTAPKPTENHAPESDASDGMDVDVPTQPDEPDFSDKASSGSDTEPPGPSSAKTYKKSVVDDDFFKLDEMEQFLNAEERKLNDPDSGNDTENSESDENDADDIDLFEAGSDEDDPVKTAKFRDYFVQRDAAEPKPKRNKALEQLEQEIEAEIEPKSAFEQRQERLGRKIDELEEIAVSEKPWQLKGEITAEKRPQNSLLEEIVEFDMSARPAPVITERTTLQLEDIIRQRIKDKVFDSVERKAKPVDTPLEYRKKLLLDQEKSKESLAQIYEREYLEQKAALDPANAEKEEETPKLHTDINRMMGALFQKLDALSNFHFTPKPAVPELRVVSNMAAISVEEVAPVAASDAALLAPEEVRTKPKGEMVGREERSGTDKKRERRKKKLKQKVHVKDKARKEAAIAKMRPGLGNKYSKEKMKEAVEKVAKDRNVDKMDESGGRGVKSSTAFFSQLEEQVKTQIKGKVRAQKLTKGKNVHTAKKMKL